MSAAFATACWVTLCPSLRPSSLRACRMLLARTGCRKTPGTQVDVVLSHHVSRVVFLRFPSRVPQIASFPVGRRAVIPTVQNAAICGNAMPGRTPHRPSIRFWRGGAARERRPKRSAVADAMLSCRALRVVLTIGLLWHLATTRPGAGRSGRRAPRRAPTSPKESPRPREASVLWPRESRDRGRRGGGPVAGPSVSGTCGCTGHGERSADRAVRKCHCCAKQSIDRQEGGWSRDA